MDALLGVPLFPFLEISPQPTVVTFFSLGSSQISFVLSRRWTRPFFGPGSPLPQGRGYPLFCVTRTPPHILPQKWSSLWTCPPPKAVALLSFRWVGDVRGLTCGAEEVRSFGLGRADCSEVRRFFDATKHVSSVSSPPRQEESQDLHGFIVIAAGLNASAPLNGRSLRSSLHLCGCAAAFKSDASPPQKVRSICFSQNFPFLFF